MLGTKPGSQTKLLEGPFETNNSVMFRRQQSKTEWKHLTLSCSAVASCSNISQFLMRSANLPISIGIMEKKMETTIVYWGLYGINGKENGNSYIIPVSISFSMFFSI